MGTCRARLLHRLPVLTLNQECHYGLSSLASETLLASSQSLNETEVRQCDLSVDYVNGRSNHVLATCCPFSVFPSCCRFESARCCVDVFFMICPCFTAMSSTLDLVTLCLVSFFQAQAVQSHVQLCEHPGRCAWARHWLGMHGRRHCATLFESHNVLHRISELGEAPGLAHGEGMP